MTIYERIKELRKASGMSQVELAHKVGYQGRSAISKVENGERDISQSMIATYAAALGVTPAYLLYGEEPDSSTSNIESYEKASIAEDGRTAEFIKLFEQLSSDQQDLIIAQIKGILSNQ